MQRVPAFVLALALAAALGAQRPPSAPEDPFAAWQRGLDALKKGDASLAASEFSAAAGAFPGIPDLLYALARAEALAGRPEKALAAKEPEKRRPVVILWMELP